MAIKQNDLRFVVSKKGEDIRTSFTPGLNKTNHDKYLNLVMSGLGIGLIKLLGNVPMLRPATENEVEAGVYIFKNPEEDNRLYQAKLAIYKDVVDYLDRLMHTLFPDVMYIQGAFERLQEAVENMTEEEAAEYQKRLEVIRDEVSALSTRDDGVE